jgi:hypothetical protein
VERFGASAPGGEMLERYGYTVDNVCKRAEALLADFDSSGEPPVHKPRRQP